MDRLVLATLWLLSACVATARVPSGITAIQGARIFDGEKVIAKGNVVFEGEQLLAVGAEAPIPVGATIVDGAGKTVLPGLIDAHFHVLSNGSLSWALQFGVTSVVDLHAAPARYARARAQAHDARYTQAEFHGAAQLIEGAGGLHLKLGTEGGFIAVTDEGSCRAAIARVLEVGAEWVKLSVDDGAMLGFPSPVMAPQVLRACIDAAHQRGARVVVHAVDSSLFALIAGSGADGIVHAPFLGRLEPATVRLLKARDVFVVPTLTCVAPIAHEDSGERLAADPALKDWLAPFDHWSLTDKYGPEWGKGLTLEAARANVRALHEAGVTVLAGDDAGGPGTVEGASLHEELEQLVRVGFTATEALASATALPAQRFGLADVGRLVPGRRADLLVVEGDPTTDILATRRIWAIYKRGTLFDREPLRVRAQVQQDAFARYTRKDYAGEEQVLSAYLAQHLNDPEFSYQLACATQLAGHPGALTWLRQAIAADSAYAGRAAGDSDLAGLRNDPEFQQLLAAPK